MLLNIFEYSFMVRAIEAGSIIAVIAPLIGVFLVLRRYSLIADTLAHVSLAGLSIGALLGMNPIFSALAATVLSSLGIERLRMTKKIPGESALALFLSGSLALAIVLFGLTRGLDTNLLNYLFGSIVTVTTANVYTIAILAAVVGIIFLAFYKKLVFATFDEEAARVSGIPIRLVNTTLILLAALTVSLSIPIVGILLISALIVIPAITALQFRRGMGMTLLYAEIVSLFSVLAGIIASFYLNTPAGGTIVLIMVFIFVAVMAWKR